MSDKNLIAITGTLGRNAEQKNTKNGTAYWELNVANSQGKDNTQWFKVVVWGPSRLDTLGPMLTKGSKVAIHGRLKLEAYQGKDGPRVSANIVATAEGIDLLFAKKDDGAQSGLFASERHVDSDEAPF